ncbi:acetyl-CoA synthetase-like protein [Hypoxylon crocopeplum]|nr:acetyl-CoA synthetase-like protein [Hypoxylon crocopeplum]
MATQVRVPYGRRLLPSVLDDLAQADPERLYAAIPKAGGVAQGFIDISVSDIARCANFMANWIDTRFGRSDRFDTLTYIGISDLRGFVVFLAAVKCGYKLLLPSPRNPPLVNISLMEQTGSTTLLYVSEVAPIVKQMKDHQESLISQIVPSFDEMMNSNPEYFPYRKTFDDARDDPIVVLHSSGSTGMPTPITMTHGTFAAVDNQKTLPEIPGRKKRDAAMWQFDGEARVYLPFPFFHVNAIFSNASLVLGPPHMVPDGSLLKSVVRQQKIRAMFLVPSVMEELLQEPNGTDVFKDLDFVAYGGAPSNPAVGDRLSKVVKLISVYGSTEMLTVPELALPREDWEWHEFNPYFKHEFQAYDDTEDICELVLIADESMKDGMAVYHNLPGITEYRTKDLFKRHPERHTLFKYYGRKDDIIVLANGEKFNPVPLEIDIQNHPSLKGALMVGNGRVQSALIIEPKDILDIAGQSKLLEELWPLIEKSNSLVPGQGRVHYGRVICARPDKPFTRTNKGTIMRKLTEQDYKDIIEESYSKTAVLPTVALTATLKRVYDNSAVVDFLRGVFAVSFAQGASINENEDFYAHGLDSVQTIEITSSLRRNLQDHLQASEPVTWISPRTVYRNPTLAELSRLLMAFLNDGTVPTEDHKLATERLLDEAVAQYTEGLPTKSTSSAVSLGTSKVALIGSTGYLGPYIVAQLLKNPQISHIYCLNRGKHGVLANQSKTLLDIDGTVEPHLHKLVYMVVNLGMPCLGLAKPEFDLLAREVDVIVYNSWRLDFGLSIRSFHQFLRATRDLAELSAGSSRNMRVVYVSSLSSVGGLAGKDGNTVPEAPVEDSSAAIDIGYAQSKLAAERILTAASRQSRIPVTIVRVCQIGGPTNGGAWPEQPWISALLRTAKTLGSVPNDLAPIDWVPVDTVAAILNAFVLHPVRDDEAQVFHVYNRNPQPWRLVVDYLNKKFGVAETVPLGEWIKSLRSIADPTAEDMARMPALKILDYFETIDNGGRSVGFATDHALSVSGVAIPTLDMQLLETWLGSWDI